MYAHTTTHRHMCCTQTYIYTHVYLIMHGCMHMHAYVMGTGNLMWVHL